MSVEFDENAAMEKGKNLANIGWTFQLLLACKSVGSVKRFTVNQNQSWDVEFYEPYEDRGCPGYR